MNITSNVLPGVRKFLNIDETSDVFDGEIVPHVMTAVSKLSQNGVGLSNVIDENTTWADILSKEFLTNPDVFGLVPLYVMLSTKILFDPPPPSVVPYYQTNLDEMLWRLRILYDTMDTLT